MEEEENIEEGRIAPPLNNIMRRFLGEWNTKAYLCNIMRLSSILRTRRRGSIILQQSCNYGNKNERDKNTESKTDKLRENIKRIERNGNLFDNEVFYITNLSKIDKDNKNIKNE